MVKEKTPNNVFVCEKCMQGFPSKIALSEHTTVMGMAQGAIPDYVEWMQGLQTDMDQVAKLTDQNVGKGGHMSRPQFRTYHIDRCPAIKSWKEHEPTPPHIAAAAARGRLVLTIKSLQACLSSRQVSGSGTYDGATGLVLTKAAFEAVEDVYQMVLPGGQCTREDLLAVGNALGSFSRLMAEKIVSEHNATAAAHSSSNTGYKIFDIMRLLFPTIATAEVKSFCVPQHIRMEHPMDVLAKEHIEEVRVLYAIHSKRAKCDPEQGIPLAYLEQNCHFTSQGQSILTSCDKDSDGFLNFRELIDFMKYCYPPYNKAQNLSEDKLPPLTAKDFPAPIVVSHFEMPSTQLRKRMDPWKCLGRPLSPEQEESIRRNTTFVNICPDAVGVPRSRRQHLEEEVRSMRKQIKLAERDVKLPSIYGHQKMRY